ncbi:inorganic pyrophosphatase [candidate division TM6 bacterium RIFCSPHIGHO2_12_FULL_32_22]|nr:MAG: inorganic pyrophosphatase [candidate division TM6 bacterium RIFCSPHIGHO2_12_FULL_32_22]
MADYSKFFHPWHSISTGEAAPKIVNSIIEITKGSKAKYELEKQTGFLRLDRILASDLCYPFHYGFLPKTYCADNDPLDILILCSEQLLPLSIVEARVLGAIEMIDNGEQDDKIIGVAAYDPFMQKIQNLEDIDKATLASIRHFFEEYKKPEGKLVEIKKFLDKSTAQSLISKGMELYKKTF